MYNKVTKTIKRYLWLFITLPHIAGPDIYLLKESNNSQEPLPIN